MPTLLAILLLCAPAAAQEATDAQAAAAARFERGLELFDEGQDAAALAEFERAYELSPAWQVLYNIARVRARIGHVVEAVDTFERYLREGGGSLAPERAAEVRAELARLRVRIARVTVETNVPASTIVVDGVDVGRTPLPAPLRIAAGRHRIGARADGHAFAQVEVLLAGDVDRRVEIELHPTTAARATLRVRSALPDVLVRVDGREIGRTPIGETIAVEPGRRVVTGERAGYSTARVVIDARDGQEHPAPLELEVDDEADPATLGRLRLRLPAGTHVLRVDGRAQTGRSHSLPAGRHRLELEVADREPVDVMLAIPAGGALEFEPDLTWTPEGRERQVEAAARRRRAGRALAVSGAALAIGGLAVGIWTERRYAGDVVEMHRYCAEERDRTGVNPLECSDATGWTRADDIEAEDIIAQTPGLRAGAYSGIAVGLAALVAGVVVTLGAPSDAEIDRAATVVGFGPGSVAVVGRF